MSAIPKSISTGTESPREKSWTLKKTICVARHGDRTPKCNSKAKPCSFAALIRPRRPGKLKFNFKGKDAWTKPFVTLLQGRTTEIILRDPAQLQYIADAADEAAALPGSDQEQLEQLKKIIEKKKDANGTKAQLKPAFTEDGKCEKVAVVVKWGGEVRLLSARTRISCSLLKIAVHPRCSLPSS